MNKPNSMKKALLIMAHGSRKQAANEEFTQLVSHIRQRVMSDISGKLSKLHYDTVSHCFLEIAEPRLATAVKDHIVLGYSEFDVYPLFFNNGHHVSRDIPHQVETIKQQHSIIIRQLNYFGSYTLLGERLLDHVITQK